MGHGAWGMGNSSCPFLLREHGAHSRYALLQGCHPRGHVSERGRLTKAKELRNDTKRFDFIHRAVRDREVVEVLSARSATVSFCNVCWHGYACASQLRREPVTLPSGKRFRQSIDLDDEFDPILPNFELSKA